MGAVAYQAGRFSQARDWLNLAETFIREGRHDGAVNRTELLEYLSSLDEKMDLLGFVKLCKCGANLGL